MNLVCPHCQKLVTVSDQNAGQMASCPLCNQNFLIPSLPQSAALPPLHLDLPVDISLTPEPAAPERPRLEPSSQPGHEDPVYKVASAPAATAKPLFSAYEREQATATPPKRAPSAAASAKPVMPTAPLTPPPPPGEYVHHRWTALNPRVMPPLVMVSIVLLFFLQFFSWTGVCPGGYCVYSQSGFQTSFGSYSKDEVGVKALGDANAFNPETVRANWLMFFYFLLVLVALVLALAPLVVTQGTLKLPPALQNLWPWRTALLGGVLVLAFLIVVLQNWIGFGIERAVAAQIDAGLQTQREAAKTGEEKEIVNIQHGLQLGRLGLTRTTWYRLAIFVQIVALLGIGLEVWLEKRGTRPLPRADFYW